MARAMKDSGIPWIGKIPENWNYGKCKSILCVNDGGVWGNDPLEDGSDKIVIRSTEQTIDGNWCIDNPAKRDLSNVDYTNSLIVEGDLLITKSSGSDLHIGKTTIADSYFSKNECYFSNFIQRIRCNDTYIPRLLWYIFNSSLVREQCVFLQNSTSGIGNINASIIDNLYIPIPERTEQKRIIAYLDTECARIDAVMEQTRESIEEYKKLKQSVITQAVTKGIRPNRPMKDSGIEWIGEIPESWDMVKLKYFLSSDKVNLRVGPFGSALSGADIKQEGVWVYNQRVVIDNNFTETNTFISEEKYEELKGFEVLPDDVLITTRGSIGKVAIVPPNAERGVLHPCVIKFRVDQNLISHTLIWYIFNCTDIAMRQIKDMSNSTTIEVLYSYSLRNVQIPLIPEEERKEIEEYIVSVANEYDRMIECKKRLLIELEEYKRALIFEYVTGKKEVV